MHADLDHVALAMHDAGPAIRTLAGDLAGTILFGGQSVGFRPLQILLGDAQEGMVIELLEPWRTDRNDFLERFLRRHGPGPHHLTFKVGSLDEALTRLEAAGFDPVNVDRSDPEWQEAFLVPREAQGTVVQLAETTRRLPTRASLLDHVARHGPDAAPKWWPDPPPSGPRMQALLERVVVRTPSLDGARGLFADLLRGEIEHEEPGSADLVWPGGGRLRLVHAPDATPGIARLEGRIAGGLSEADIEVAGTRLLLACTSSARGRRTLAQVRWRRW